MFCHRGQDVYLFVNGNIRKVASCKVKPFKTASESDKDECDDKVDCKKGKTVTIELGENVLEADNIEKKFEDDLISVEKDRVDVEKDTVGSFWMLVENNECYNYEITSYVVELPSHQHKKPEVIDAKQIELKNLQDYETYEEVEDTGQDRITSRWVVTMKEEHDGQKTKFKARLVARGFQEEEPPLSDSPTVLRESNKLFTAVAANQSFEIVSIDIRAAFLQAKELKRDVFLVPPKDIVKPGILWKLKKPLYGLNDASRRFWLRVKEVFKKENMKSLPGDEAFYYKHDESGNLIGMIITHVDDFQIAGQDEFIDCILEKLRNTLTVSKIERSKFRFTGIDVEKVSDGVVLSMEDYAQSIEEIKEIRRDKKDSPLTKTEMKLFRKYVGKLSWLAENTRPDLAIWALNLSLKNSNATIGDLKKINQIVKKVKSRQSRVKFTRIGDRDDIAVHSVGDASYKCDAQSIGGNLIMMGNKTTRKVSPLYWKSKRIQKVCHSAKDAETRNIMKNVDTSVYLSEQLSVLLFGSEKMIPVKIYTDSLPILESIASSCQVEQRLLRNTMTDLKQKLIDGDISSYCWIDTKAMTADILTKEGGEIENILEVVRENVFKKANTQQNMVVFQDSEMMLQNPLVKRK